MNDTDNQSPLIYLISHPGRRTSAVARSAPGRGNKTPSVATQDLDYVNTRGLQLLYSQTRSNSVRPAVAVPARSPANLHSGLVPSLAARPGLSPRSAR